MKEAAEWRARRARMNEKILGAGPEELLPEAR